MRSPLVALAAAVMLTPALTLALEYAPMEPNNAAAGQAEKPKFPDLKAKEWKKVGTEGLEIWDVKEGEGEAVKADAKVTVYYIGWLTNGKEFDGNFGDKPISFGLNQVIKGWTQGIPGMKPGGTRRLKIPAALGYGARGAGTDIPPNADLIFEVKLVK